MPDVDHDKLSVCVVRFLAQPQGGLEAALVIDPPTDVMAFVGGYFNALVPEAVLRAVLAVLVVAGALMLRNSSFQASTRELPGEWWHSQP